MSLKNVILGYLEEPASGYDIKQSIDQNLSHLWAAESSQVYAKLRSMEKEGLLTSVKEKSNKGPNRRVYRRTEMGDEAFANWLESDPELSHERLSVLAQIHFLSQSRDSEKTTDLLQSLRSRFVERLEKYEALKLKEEQSETDASEELFDKLALDLSMKTLQARIEWCDKAIQQISLLNEQGTSHA